MILFPYLDSTQVILTDVGRRQASILAVQGGGGGGWGDGNTGNTQSFWSDNFPHIILPSYFDLTQPVQTPDTTKSIAI